MITQQGTRATFPVLHLQMQYKTPKMQENQEEKNPQQS